MSIRSLSPHVPGAFAALRALGLPDQPAPLLALPRQLRRELLRTGRAGHQPLRCVGTRQLAALAHCRSHGLLQSYEGATRGRGRGGETDEAERVEIEGAPASATVGTSGSVGARSAEVTASTRT